MTGGVRGKKLTRQSNNLCSSSLLVVVAEEDLVGSTSAGKSQPVSYSIHFEFGQRAKTYSLLRRRVLSTLRGTILLRLGVAHIGLVYLKR